MSMLRGASTALAGASSATRLHPMPSTIRAAQRCRGRAALLAPASTAWASPPRMIAWSSTYANPHRPHTNVPCATVAEFSWPIASVQQGPWRPPSSWAPRARPCAGAARHLSSARKTGDSVDGSTDTVAAEERKLADALEKETQASPPGDAPGSWFARMRQQSAAMLHQLRMGFALMWRDLKLAASLLRQSLDTDKKLTSRERRHLLRSALDTLKLAPFFAAVVLPGGSLLIPIAMKVRRSSCSVRQRVDNWLCRDIIVPHNLRSHTRARVSPCHRSPLHAAVPRPVALASSRRACCRRRSWRSCNSRTRRSSRPTKPRPAYRHSYRCVAAPTHQRVCVCTHARMRCASR